MSKAKLFLVFREGERKGEFLTMTQSAVFGRKSPAELVVDAESISTRHAEILVEGESFSIKDLESTNGTRLAGRRITQEKLTDGDILSLGTVNFLVRIVQKELPRLSIFAKEWCDREIAVATTPFTMGRLAENDLAITDASASSRHARIVQEADVYLLEDLESTNGTRINGSRISRAPLRDGDEIALGQWKMLFLHGQQEEAQFALRFLHGEREGQEIPLPPILTIGRRPENDVVLTDKKVSGNHARLSWKNNRFWLEDLQSSNGTMVSGVRISQRPLNHGEEIFIGETSMLFRHLNLPLEKFFLVFLEGNREGEERELTEESLLFGRHESCQIVLDDASISSRHMEITAQKGKFILRDLGSTNGTLVNGKRVTEPHELRHGETFQIGSQLFVFRSTAQARPAALQEESFVLIRRIEGKRGLGERLKLGERLTIGRTADNGLVLKSTEISERHAIILQENKGFQLQDCQSTNGTWVNGQKIQTHLLSHGDEIRIGPYTYIFKNTLRPLHLGPQMAAKVVNYWLPLIAAAATILFLLAIFVGPALKKTVTSEQATTDKTSQQPQQSEEEILAQGLQEAEKLVGGYRFAEALTRLKRCRPQVRQSVQVAALEDRLALLDPQARVFQRLQQAIRTTRGDGFSIATRGKKTFLLQDVDEASHSLLTQDGQAINWEQIPPAEFLRLCDHFQCAADDPYTLAMTAIALGVKDRVEPYLVQHLKAYPQQKERVDEAFARFLNQPIPPEGFVIHQGRLVTAARKKALAEEERQRLEMAKIQAEQARQAELQLDQEKARQEALRLEQEKEKEEFSFLFTTIDEFVHTYSYRQALEKFEALAKRLQIAAHRDKVARRIAEIRPMADLFESLIKAINEGKLIDPTMTIGGIQGRIQRADLKEFEIVFREGSFRHRWYRVPPVEVYGFLNRLPPSRQNQYLVGVFCCENGLWKEGNTTFIELGKRDAVYKKRIDTYLSARLGVPIPEGGFVPYRGTLVSPDEREKRQSGLVRYGDQWVTPEDKKKMEAGYVKYEGGWITLDDEKLLKKGYRRYKEKWYTREEIVTIRSQWDDAWDLKTDHYDIRSNVSEEFTQELGRFMEAVFLEYVKAFGRNTQNRMIIFAFRTYEDYRDYCLKNNSEAQLRAGGFASSANNTGVGWTRNDLKELLNTMAHEGAHLFHYNAAARVSFPSWFAEAVATQFEGYQWDGQILKMNHISANRLSWVKRRFLNNKYIPIQDLVKGEALEHINRDPEDAATFYAECWALYHFLSRAPEENDRKRFLEFCQKTNDGVYPRDGTAFLDIFGADLDRLETAWKAYILSMN